MKNLQSFLLEEQEIFGPGTDLVISLVAVLIILMAISTDSFRQQLKQLEQSVVDCQELKSELQTCQAQLAEYKTQLAEYKTQLEDCKEKHRQCEVAKEELERIKKKLEHIMEQSGIGQIDIKVEENQMAIVNGIAQKYKQEPSRIEKGIEEEGIEEGSYEIRTPKGGKIVIQNDIILQRIRFGSHILFGSDEVELKDEGKKVLTTVGNVFKEKLDWIKEIQIQGHADPKRSQKSCPNLELAANHADKGPKKPCSNLELAANRAIKVFMFLQEELGIDPTRHIMSATSFGEYKPIQRLDTEEYDDSMLKEHNKTDAELKRNRRIEIVLIYRRIREGQVLSRHSSSESQSEGQ